MKKLVSIIIAIIVVSIIGFFVMTSKCEESALNYKNAIVIEKNKKWSCNFLRLRHYYQKTKNYRLDWIIVPEFEYNSYNIGDTIK